MARRYPGGFDVSHSEIPRVRAEFAIAQINKGFQFVSVLNDGKIMANAARDIVNKVKAET